MGNGEWEYATEVPAGQLEATVDGLVAGKTYQFRVKAVNKAGESAPSDPSRTLLAKSRRRKSSKKIGYNNDNFSTAKD